jgi:ribosomal protein S3
MKRTNPDHRGGSTTSGGAGSKRYRNNDGYADALAEGKFELRFLIPTKCAGAVIGRGGEKIKSIRDKVVFYINY